MGGTRGGDDGGETRGGRGGDEGGILESERLLSKPGPFNFKIFGAGEDEDIDPQGTAEVDDVPGVPGEDVVAEKNPFSLEEVDIAKEDVGNLEAQ